MKVKRFIAADMRSAMSQVRDSLGAEAVILSNRMVDDGVEILASNDYVDNSAQSSPAPKRQYRTYADVPNEVDNAIPDDRVSLLAEASKNTSTQSTLSKLTQRNKAASNKKAASTASIFDRRQRLNENFDQTQEDRAAKTSVDQSSAKEQTAISQQQKPAARQVVDYSKYIVDDEVAPVAKVAVPEQLQNESLKQELQALRSMMETQISLMNWDGQKKQNPVTTGLLKRLSELGLTVDISKQVIDKVSNNNDAKMASKEAINELIKLIPTASDDILSRQGVVALVGPTGVGKTTTIAKLAARYVMANGADQMALVTLDNYRIGAQEQLFNYAKILGVSVHNAKNSNELHKILQNLYEKKLVLIDTAGMSQKDMRICEQFNTLKQGTDEVRSYVVVAANAQTSALDEIIKAFKQTELAGCILTKLDEAASLGGAISMLIRHQLPVSYLSDGQAVPEDLETAYARELVSKALAMLKKRPEQINELDLAIAFNEGLIHEH